MLRPVKKKIAAYSLSLNHFIYTKDTCQMDITKFMILINGEDKTTKVASFSRNQSTNKITIVYQKGFQSYLYNEANVRILESPKIIDLKGVAAYINDEPLYEPQCILDFGVKIRVIQFNGSACTTDPDTFTIVKSSINDQNSQQILEYLREIAQYTAGKQEEAFLGQEMNQLTFVHPESVLSSYLLKKPVKTHPLKSTNFIFPFSYNLSQRAALEQALTHSISVIEGPPGTGKTQTILNILANLVIRKQSVAVVSNNNEAVKNVLEKLQKDHYGFLAAFLGKNENQKAFFEDMPVPDVVGWEVQETEQELSESIRRWNTELTELMDKEREKARKEQELLAWKLEEEHFETYLVQQNVEEIIKLPLLCRTPDKILSFIAETSVAKECQQTKKLLFRIKLLLKYGVLNTKKLSRQEVPVLLAMQKRYYQLQIQQLEQHILELSEQLKQSSFEELKRQHQEASAKLFRKYLFGCYRDSTKPNFTKKKYKGRFSEFIKTYPILLSTTYSLRRSIPQNALLDYVIIDESSQVDLITGVLAFSCCKNVIIVGDLKQLSQITDEKIKDKLQTPSPSEEYNYFSNSILSSVLALYRTDLTHVILREHYRCHPQIIEFCNQKYYDGQLIAYTKSAPGDCPLVLYKTSEGNHMRRITRGENKGIYNQREIDVIVEEILNNPEFEGHYEDIGVVTPYRKQADKAAGAVNSKIASDTVHKYQGREKNTIIMSTVLDSSWYGQSSLKFVDKPQMVNVAVSRAIDRFILVTDHDLFFKRGENIEDLIRYMQYSTLDENVIESQVVSIFDLLYQNYSRKLLPIKAKMNSKAQYQSEEALRVLLEEMLEQPEYSRYRYSQGVLLQNLLKDTGLLTEQEKTFVRNRASLDFVLFYKQDKSCVLVIEVDGFAFHENQPEQLLRDAMKDEILRKYCIPFLRLATNGSQERGRIAKMLGKNTEISSDSIR